MTRTALFWSYHLESPSFRHRLRPVAEELERRGWRCELRELPRKEGNYLRRITARSDEISAADLMVMPYRDGASLRRGTLMAAMAHGRPLITTTPAARTPELVHGENVWLVPPGDAVALAAAMEALVAAPARRDKLGAAAAVTAEQFTWDKIAARTAAFLDALPAPRHPDVI